MVPDLCAKFQPCTIYGFWVTGIETEEQQQQQEEEELQEWTSFNISYVPHANFVIF